MDNVKYLLNRTKFLANGGVKALEPSVHDDLQSAQAKYHRNIGTDMDDTTLSGSVSVITDTDGNSYESFTWGKIVEKPIEG